MQPLNRNELIAAIAYLETRNNVVTYVSLNFLD